MSEQGKQGVNKVEETQQEITDSPNGSSPSKEKSEEEVQLEAKKAQLEEEVRGLEGTINSLKDDIVRKRQERKGVESEEQQTAFDKEALLAELEERNKAILQPFMEENEKLRQAVLKSNEETLKAKKAALDSINARMASATAAKPSSAEAPEKEPEVELDSRETEVAKLVGLENPRYMKEVEVL